MLDPKVLPRLLAPLLARIFQKLQLSISFSNEVYDIPAFYPPRSFTGSEFSSIVQDSSLLPQLSLDLVSVLMRLAILSNQLDFVVMVSF